MSIFPKSNEPNVSAIKPEPTERVKRIFQEECNLENMDVKFGKTLSAEENEVRKFILTQSPILGRITSINEIKKAFNQFPKDEIDGILNKLDKLDVIHLNDEKTAITAAYPFSGAETSHIVTMNKEGYKKIYAMCAVDALGVCFMYNCDVSIESKCHHCDDKVEIEIKNNEIVSIRPKNVVVWNDRDYSCCAATSCCPYTNFFSSKHHFEEWQQGKIQRKGNLLQIQEAFYLGRLSFENRI